jgi:CheY-like chemotaxis protein
MGTFRVLVVEDNADDEFIALWALKRLGIDQVAVARDGSEALDLMFGGGDRPAAAPDLVILDLRMPRIGGVEVLRRIRADASTGHLPVLILTSSEDISDKERCRSLGIIDFISKPLRADTLREILVANGMGERLLPA